MTLLGDFQRLADGMGMHHRCILTECVHEDADLFSGSGMRSVMRLKAVSAVYESEEVF
jgi:hypothetical protein